MNTAQIIEYTAAALALGGVGMMTMRMRLGWVLNFLSCLLYTWVFYNSKLYGDAALQIGFGVMQVWGWFQWKKKVSTDALKLRSLSFDGLWNSLLIALGGSLLLGLLLGAATDTAVPWSDAFCTSGSLVAQVLQIGRFRDNWTLWILVNLVYVPLYVYKGLTATAILYAVFLLMAVWGLWQWNKKLRIERQNQASA